jgi:hypothetical protein
VVSEEINDAKEALEPAETHEANGKEIVMPTSRYTISERELENETYYRKVREHEVKDDLAIRIMNLTNDTHTTTLKELAATYLAERF